jgi:hypothetical protein
MCMKIYRHGSSKNPQIFCFVPNEARPTWAIDDKALHALLSIDVPIELSYVYTIVYHLRAAYRDEGPITLSLKFKNACTLTYALDSNWKKHSTDDSLYRVSLRRQHESKLYAATLHGLFTQACYPYSWSRVWLTIKR